MKLIHLETIKKDAFILIKYITDSKYMEKLEETYKIIEALKIKDKKTYYQYQLILNQLKGINYYEATFLERISNKEHLEMVKKLIQIEENTKRI